MPNIKAVLEYDGTDYHGFQIQPSLPTIQRALAKAAASLFRLDDIKITAAGRTDAGVHATGQVISFKSPDYFPSDRLRPALNSLLPRVIRLKSVEEVDDEFHARYSAKSRTYVYVVLNRDEPTALLSRYTWHIMRPLDIDSMRNAAKQFLGRKDFSTFGVPDKVGASAERDILNFGIKRRKDAVFFKVQADAFLRGMVRAMAGTLVEVGSGKRNPAEIAEMLSARDRRAAGISAPPKGLFLTRVEY